MILVTTTPPSYTKITGAYITLFSEDYSLDGQNIEIHVVVVSVNGNLGTVKNTFMFKVEYKAHYCD